MHLGLRQSPINIITKDIRRDIDKSVTVTGRNVSGNLHLANANGEIKVDTKQANAVLKAEEGDRNYVLANFHAHAPSEHTIDGEYYDLEIHNVFQLSSTSVATYMVVGILFELDVDARDIDFLSALPTQSLVVGSASQDVAITDVNYQSFIEWTNGKAKYNYKGSLTTPTCSENVEWMLVKEPMKINANQLNEFTKFFAGNPSFAAGHGNNRAVQPVNTRQVYLTQGDDGKFYSDHLGRPLVEEFLSVYSKSPLPSSVESSVQKDWGGRLGR